MCHTTPYIVDTSAPFVHEISNLRYDEKSLFLYGDFNIRYTILLLYSQTFRLKKAHFKYNKKRVLGCNLDRYGVHVLPIGVRDFKFIFDEIAQRR